MVPHWNWYLTFVLVVGFVKVHVVGFVVVVVRDICRHHRKDVSQLLQ